jgi:hypothetical protein
MLHHVKKRNQNGNMKYSKPHMKIQIPRHKQAMSKENKFKNPSEHSKLEGSIWKDLPDS